MGRPVILNNFEKIPQTALVMGGNWDTSTPPEDLVLSPESQLRVMALGALATNGIVDTAIFCAGLTRGPNDTPEAEVQHDFLLRNFPELKDMKLFEEDMGHTTKADAIYTKELVDNLGLRGPFLHITTRAFSKRQVKVFEREGFEIKPVIAEPWVASISPEHAEEVRRYRRSPRHLKIVASETILQGLQIIDPDSRLTEFLAARSRPNHKAA